MKHRGHAPLPPRERMMADAAALGLDLAEGTLERMETMAALLEERSGRVNLVGPSEMGRLWPRHFLESAAYALLLDPGVETVDVGSGAGFPGLVLASMGFPMLLLEPRRKRRLFLELAAREMGLEGVEVVGERLESAAFLGTRRQFAARAVAPPERLLEEIPSRGRGEAALTLTLRLPSPPLEEPAPAVILSLPVPPLDRSGALVQYRCCHGPPLPHIHEDRADEEGLEPG